MPNYTTNYNLKKPLGSEQFTVDDANGNMDIIDTTLLSKVDKVSGKSLVSDADITDLTDGNETTLHKHSAANTPNTPSGNISSTTVQGAINELDTEKADKLFATNLVTNGDFSNGTTGWTNSFSSLSVASNTATVTGNGGASSARLEQAESVTNGIKYYLRARARVTNSLATSISLILWNAVSAQEAQAQATPTINQFYNLSGVITSTNTSAVGAVWVTSFYADATTQNGKVMEVQYVSMINLTAIFGVGKEPTKEQMDWLLAQKYANSWFDGTKELCSITDLLTLVNTKADKAQEAWITPTLLNGATFPASVEGLKFRKNQFGNIEFKGEIVTVASGIQFVLPSGYFSTSNVKRNNIWVIGSNTRYTYQISTNGEFAIYGTSQFSLDGLVLPSN